MPFFWQHGEDEATLREMMAAIDGANCRAVCVESRPHPDFCGPKWWADMDIILDEAKKRNMKVWILDDSHFPTGFANGAVLKAPQELCRQNIFSNEKDLPSEVGEVNIDLRAEKLLDAPQKVFSSPMEAMFFNKPPARVYDDDRILSVTAIRSDGDETDLKDFVSGERLVWLKPEGHYTLRVITASRNSGYHRDYINMTDEESVKILLDSVYEAHWAHYAADFGGTIAGFFSDEPELGNGFLYEKGNLLGCRQDLPWSAALEREISGKLGQGWERKLSHLWQQNESDETARVHYVYMDALTKLVRENFSEQIGSWCHAHGVQYIGHVIEDDGQHCRTGSSLGHYFRGLQGQDMAGIDDIGGQVLPQGEDAPVINNMRQPRSGEFYHYGLAKLAQSAAAIEPIKNGNAMCEIFGNYGWEEGVQLEKYLADHFLVRGINYFVPHAFSGKDFPDPDCPPHFYAHGHNPQYRHFGKLIQYMNRAATLTASGRHQVPVAVLYHGEAEWCDSEAMPFEKPLRALYDQQIDCHVLPSDIFAEPERYQTVLGNPLTVNGQEYQAFVVPGCKRITKEAADGLARLKKLGLPVYFVEQRPGRLCDSMDSASNAEKETIDPWALPEELKDCPVVTLAELPVCIRGLGIAAPALSPASDRIRILHIQGDTSCYMLVSEAAQPYQGTIRLPETMESCFIYDAWENRCEKADVTADEEGTLLSITLEPLKSRFLISSPCSVQFYDLAIKDSEIALTQWTRSICEGSAYPDFAQEKEVVLPDTLAEEQPEFSGFVRYETFFTLDKDEKLCLEIEDAKEGVEVFINGQSVGIQIAPPYRYDLTGSAGENVLVIEVATTLERQCYPLLEGYRKMLAKPPVSEIGLTGNVRLWLTKEETEK
ncbi:MAG: hypothetical protein LUC95_07205 [Lachnospiraceae bacterium]|nr:hypothetical protein [Lachnospiraceae bacterium]